MNASAGMERLKGSRYPGRGIVIGMTPDEKHLVQIYWIMGRSPSSRNRIFVREGDGVKTDAVDTSQKVDPLTMYYPVRVAEGTHVVSNGDQTDTICEALKRGGTFEAALMTRTFEPDGPNYTPRISGIVDLKNRAHAYQIAILKTVGGDARYCSRQFFNYETAIPGVGHCMTTYIDDDQPLPSFEGEPFCVALGNDLAQTATVFWEMLDEDNRVSLLVKFIDVSSGAWALTLVNKFET